ncbi:hypothetical protein N7523_000663 [Penicillium sp. IBT 18751x]|nr:hypothetical protein N7523_000663 [Penicillium sp. IBT 18751x]
MFSFRTKMMRWLKTIVSRFGLESIDRGQMTSIVRAPIFIASQDTRPTDNHAVGATVDDIRGIFQGCPDNRPIQHSTVSCTILSHSINQSPYPSLSSGDSLPIKASSVTLGCPIVLASLVKGPAMATTPRLASRSAKRALPAATTRSES